jgi:hypothetical protein
MQKECNVRVDRRKQHAVAENVGENALLCRLEKIEKSNGERKVSEVFVEHKKKIKTNNTVTLQLCENNLLVCLTLCC